jgi:auxin-responsive protein IAA
MLYFREETFDWPPVNKSVLRRNKQIDIHDQRSSLFVKVYMEGIPIGRKLNLLEHDSYDGLVKALCHMFRTMILCKHSHYFLLLDLTTIYNN